MNNENEAIKFVNNENEAIKFVSNENEAIKFVSNENEEITLLRMKKITLRKCHDKRLVVLKVIIRFQFLFIVNRS